MVKHKIVYSKMTLDRQTVQFAWKIFFNKKMKAMKILSDLLKDSGIVLTKILT